MAEYFVSGVALPIVEYFDVALSILDRGNFISDIRNVASWNISSMASHYQYYIAENFVYGIVVTI